jgi:hypothetical protein
MLFNILNAFLCEKQNDHRFNIPQDQKKRVIFK